MFGHWAEHNECSRYGLTLSVAVVVFANLDVEVEWFDFLHQQREFVAVVCFGHLGQFGSLNVVSGVVFARKEVEYV